MSRLHSLQRMLRRRYPHWRRTAGLLALASAATLIVVAARAIDWERVWRAMRDIPGHTLAAAVGLCLAGYLAYGGLDLLGRLYTRHRLGRVSVLGAAMLSYAFNLNLGVLIGGLGVRVRLYALLGCRKAVPIRVALFSALSNWGGYGWLAGALLLGGWVPVPTAWEIGQHALRALGGALLCLSGVYVLACAALRQRSWPVAGQRLHLPSWKMALAQGVVAAVSWCLMGVTVWTLLGGAAPLPAVLGVLLFASLAALIIRVPGGLGSTEAIFVAAFSPTLPAAQVLGSLLAYRAVYFLAPLALALAGMTVIEASVRRRRRG